MVLPLLREALPDVAVVSWIPDVDERTFPLLAMFRKGGARHPTRPDLFDHPTLEMLAVSADSLAEAEDVYGDALEALYGAVKDQTVVDGVGYLHSVSEQQGLTQTVSPFPDSWAARGMLALGLRPV